jgi:hypothetical protein
MSDAELSPPNNGLWGLSTLKIIKRLYVKRKESNIRHWTMDFGGLLVNLQVALKTCDVLVPRNSAQVVFVFVVVVDSSKRAASGTCANGVAVDKLG